MRILIILQHIDFFAFKLADDVLDTNTLQADTGAHGVNIALVGIHGNLGAVASLADNLVDGNSLVANLRNFKLHDALHEFRIRTAQHQLDAGSSFLQINDERLNAVVLFVGFARTLVVVRKHAFNLSQINVDVSVVHTLVVTDDNLPDLILVFVIQIVLEAFVERLMRSLLTGRNSGAGKVMGIHFNVNLVAQSAFIAQLTGFLKFYFHRRVIHAVHNSLA